MVHRLVPVSYTHLLSPSASAVEITIDSLADHWAANETINLFRYSLSATNPFTLSLPTSLVNKVAISVFNAFITHMFTSSNISGDLIAAFILGSG